jgi:hypothetical protein
MGILVDFYNATKRCVPEEATPLAKKILDQCEKHPGLKAEFLKNEDHYRWLFT